MEEIKCAKCKILKLKEDFYFDTRRGITRPHCKACVKDKAKEYRKNNKESISEYNRLYRERAKL